MFATVQFNLITKNPIAFENTFAFHKLRRQTNFKDLGGFPGIIMSSELVIGQFLISRGSTGGTRIKSTVVSM